MTMVQAINLALHQEMARDKSVMVLGEDVGRDGGVFRVTDGLLEKFGEARVADTPLAELGIVGCAVGLALGGMKPVAEIQFDGFTIPSFDQLFNHAARLRWRTRGKVHVPLVLRFPYGAGVKALEHHSDSPEAFFCHAPGLKVVAPGTPYDAKGLMASAVRDDDSVIFMEPKKVYRAIKEEVPEEEYTIPLGEAKIVSEGSDVTLVCWGAFVKSCKEVVERAAAENISVELIDLRTLKPLDEDKIIESVKKTGRVVVAHEAPKMAGLGAEVTSIIVEKAFLSLEAPVERVAGFDTVMPLPKMEHYYYPSGDRILNAVRKVNSF